ncbi:MAG: hypothetical protein U0105_25520 [Candidatus Obscuribacterales bacterium]
MNSKAAALIALSVAFLEVCPVTAQSQQQVSGASNGYVQSPQFSYGGMYSNCSGEQSANAMSAPVPMQQQQMPMQQQIQMQQQMQMQRQMAMQRQMEMQKQKQLQMQKQAQLKKQKEQQADANPFSGRNILKALLGQPTGLVDPTNDNSTWALHKPSVR